MMMSVLDKGRVGIAALAVGIGQAGLEAAVDYAGQRRQFGKAIAEFQGVQWLLADMAKDIEAARLLVHSGGGEDRPRARTRRWPARWPSASPATWRWRARPMRCRSSAARATSAASRSSGCTATPRSRQIYEGTNQIQRMIIARELLKKGARAMRQVALVTGAERGHRPGGGRGAGARGLRRRAERPAGRCRAGGGGGAGARRWARRRSACAFDVSDLSRAMTARWREIEAALGPLTTLVNNAGVGVLARGDLLDVSEASYDRCHGGQRQGACSS